MKYMCTRCGGSPCLFDSQDNSDTPINCPYYAGRVNWKLADESPAQTLNKAPTECLTCSKQCPTDCPLDKQHDPRRYEIAKAVMAGLAASLDLTLESFPKGAAKQAVEWADALIAELDKEKTK